MAITRTLQQTVQWAQTLSQMIPIVGVAGVANEPALTICNNVIQEMIAKPYNWKFNSVDGPTFYTVANYGVGTTPCAQATPACPFPCQTIYGASATTIDGSGNLTGNFPDYLNYIVGANVYITGFANPLNNGIFPLASAASGTAIQVTNANAVAETGQNASISVNFCMPSFNYVLAVTNVAWVEAAWIINNLSTAIPQPLNNLEVVRVIRPTSQMSNPLKFAWMYETTDPTTGAVTGGTVRLWPMPSIAMQWQVGWTYQMKVPIKTALTQSWAPFPDEMQWVYNKGFLAMAYKHAGDPRYTEAYAEFQAAMLKELGHLDSEGNAEGFQPDFGLFIG